MPKTVQSAPEAIKEVVRPEVRQSFEKLGLDMGEKMEKLEQKTERVSDQVKDRMNSSKRYVLGNQERFERDCKRFEKAYSDHSEEFEKAFSELSSKTKFNPDQVKEVNTQKERQTEEKYALHEQQLENQQLVFNSSVKKLNDFETKTTSDALNLSLKIQDRFDAFVESAEEKLANAKPEEVEAVRKDLQKEANQLVNDVSKEVDSFLSSVKKEQTELNKEVKQDMAESLNTFKKEYDLLIAEQTLENSKLLANLKLNSPELQAIMGNSFNTMTPEEQKQVMDLCDPQEMSRRMDSTIMRVGGLEPEYTELSETQVTDRNIKEIRDNAYKELSRYKSELAPDTYKMCEEFIDKTTDLLDKALKEGELDGVDSKSLDGIMRDSVQKLVFQDIESRKRQLGDHGVRHILGNFNMQEQIFDSLDKAGIHVTPKERFMAAVVQINHDIGYTSEISIFKSDKYHKQYSGKLFEAEKDKFSGVFNPDELAFMKNAIETHDDSSLNWQLDPINSAIRMSDNLALFSAEKLPTLFKEIPGSLDILSEMKVAAMNGDHDSFAVLKADLREKVYDSDLPYQIKRDLMHAADEVNERSADFTLGMVAGKIGEISFDEKESYLNVSIQYDDTRAMLQQMGFFDMEVKQFNKLAKELGCPLNDPSQTVFEMKDASGKMLVKVQIA